MWGLDHRGASKEHIQRVGGEWVVASKPHDALRLCRVVLRRRTQGTSRRGRVHQVRRVRAVGRRGSKGVRDMCPVSIVCSWWGRQT